MEQTFVSKVFWLVAQTLQKIASFLHLTYNEVNVIIYYGIIPLSWCILFDLIVKKPISTILFIILWTVILSFVKSFSNWCDKVFILSQQFIRFFGEYVKYSVVICVIVPIIIYLILILLLLK